MTTRKNYAFSKNAFKYRTPTWANNVVLGVVCVTSVATFIIASDPAIPAETAVRIGVYLKGFDMLIGLLSKAFGVDVKVIK